jgi:hypothetical protein
MGRPSDSGGAPERQRFSIPRPGWVGFLAFVLVLVAVGLNIGAPIYRERVALQALRPLVLRGGLQFHQTGPRWLRQWAGERRMEVFDKVESITLQGPLVNDDTLLNLRGLSRLQKVVLMETQVTDVGLQGLKSLPGLTDVVPIRNSAITAGAVAELRRTMPSLRVHY